MKETELKLKDEIVLSKKAEVKKGLKKVGSTRIKPGHTLWEWNYEKDELKPVEVEKKVVIIPASRTYSTMLGRTIDKPAGTKITSRVVIKENCQYFGALNRKNAIKKIKNSGFNTKLL